MHRSRAALAAAGGLREPLQRLLGGLGGVSYGMARVYGQF